MAEEQDKQEEVQDNVTFDTPEVIAPEPIDRWERYQKENGLLEEPEEKPVEKKEETTEETTEEQVVETTEDKQEAPQLKYEHDKLLYDYGDEKHELEKVDLGDGKFGFLPKDKKSDYLAHADYTRKTQELAQQRNQFIEERAKAEEALKAIILENQAYTVGQEKSLNDFLYAVDDKGEYKYSSEDEAKKAFSDYQTEFTKVRTEFEINRQKADIENRQIEENFRKEFPNVQLEEVVKELGNYINPMTSKGQIPYPQDVLKIFYLGKNFDKLVQERIDKVKSETVRELNKETKKKDTPAKQTPTTTPKNEVQMDDRWANYLKSLET